MAGIVLAGLLSACATLLGPRTVEVPLERLQTLVGQRFPIDRRIADVIDVHIDAPRLSLMPAANRVAIELELGVAVGDRGQQPSRAGSLAGTAGIRYEPNDQTLRLFDVRIDRFALDGLPAILQRQIDRTGRPVGQALLEGQVLYTLRPKDVAGFEAYGFRPGDIRVTSSGLAITLVPLER